MYRRVNRLKGQRVQRVKGEEVKRLKKFRPFALRPSAFPIDHLTH